MTKVIALKPNHVVTEIRGLRKTGSSYHRFQKRIFRWKRFYKRRLKRFIGMTIYVKTVNTVTGQWYYGDFYVHPDHNGNLRLW